MFESTYGNAAERLSPHHISKVSTDFNNTQAIS